LCRCGSADGAVEIDIIGGQAPYDIFPMQTTGLVADDYTYTITDLNGCTTSVVIPVTAPTALITTIDTIVPISCFGASDGQVVLETVGGDDDYDYDWGDFNPFALAAGTYVVTITDDNLCEGLITVELESPSQVEIIDTEVMGLDCIGDNDASVSFSVQGGTGVHTINWGGFNPEALSFGVYMVVISIQPMCLHLVALTVVLMYLLEEELDHTVMIGVVALVLQV